MCVRYIFSQRGKKKKKKKRAELVSRDTLALVASSLSGRSVQVSKVHLVTVFRGTALTLQQGRVSPDTPRRLGKRATSYTAAAAAVELIKRGLLLTRLPV